MHVYKFTVIPNEGPYREMNEEVQAETLLEAWEVLDAKYPRGLYGIELRESAYLDFQKKG